ncbi:hypothetical protein [Clostridium sp.]|uniref:hypothetical protein n=1 Tax=Clostridium sp. TaxID=1506 RepID=UPI001A4F5228|nr:hypothetical protein [Clostridium sp.]MBK5242965.1 hypothetical protein [Clostridium sp.]
MLYFILTTIKLSKSNEPLLEAITLLNELNDAKKRTIPNDAPVDFISSKWNKYVFEKDGTINSRYYEMAILTELKKTYVPAISLLLVVENIRILWNTWYQKKNGH